MSALGAADADAPLARKPARGVSVRIGAKGYTVAHRGAAVSLTAADAQRQLVGASLRTGWTRFSNGVSRPTWFGRETITVERWKTEQFLTVQRYQGPTTWRWQLAATLTPKLAADGGVDFLAGPDPGDGHGHHHGPPLAEFRLAPVAILDRNGKDITPEGLRWSLARDGSATTLELRLDDSELPLPYVIDPAITFRAAASMGNGGESTLVISTPTGTAAGDFLIAGISVRGGSGTAITPPPGWSLVRREDNGTAVSLAIYSKVAGASEPASHTWTQSPAARAAGGIITYSNVNNGDPIDVTSGGIGTGTLVAAPSVTTTVPNTMVLAFYAIANCDTGGDYWTAPGGMAERYDVNATGNFNLRANAGASDVAQALAGPSGDKTAVARSSAGWVGMQVALKVDETPPTSSLSVAEGTRPDLQHFDAGTYYYNPIAAADFTVDNAAADGSGSGVASVAFPAIADTGFTGNGNTDTTSPYASTVYSFDATNATAPTAKTVTVTDYATNATNDPITFVRDATAPNAFSLTAPLADADIMNGENVSAAPTDADAGIAQVEFRYCAGATCAFDSGTTIDVADTTAPYSVSWTSQPADGTYTVVTRATDNVGNTTDSAPTTVTVDNTLPTQSLALTNISPAGSAFKSGPTIFYRGASAGSFQLRNTVTDPASGGPASSTTSALGGTTTGWSHTGSTVSTPAGGPYDSNGFSWAAGTTTSPTVDVHATDEAGNDSATTTLTFTNDSGAPPAPTTSFPTASAAYRAGTWDAGCGPSGLCGSAGADAGAGLARVEVSIRRDSTGNYWDGSSFASSTEVFQLASGTSSWSYAFGSSSFPADDTYTVHARSVDNVGNLAAAGAFAFIYDDTAPLAPSALGTSPASPANGNDPKLTGTAEAGSTVTIYATTDCTGAVDGSGPAATFGGAGIDVSNVVDNSTTTFTAKAADAAGNQSPCSTAVSYVEDSIAPAAPGTLDSSPGSPANNNSPSITGSADAGSTVRLYTTSDCSGAPVASGTAANFATPGVGVTVADNTSTTFKATATDAAGNTSPCSSGFTYVEDSTAPSAPSSLGTNPASPANNNDPKLTGTAEAGSTVNLYATADCTGSSVGSGSAALFAGAGIDTTNVADDTTTSYTAKTTDAAGNASTCSTATGYIEDSTAPSAPGSLGTTPASPANNNDPKLTGTAEAGSTVNLYASADCSGAATGSGSAASFAGGDIDVTNVADNSTTSYTAKATDAAGNASPCSAPISYVEDSAAPSAPTIDSSAPASPANDNDPEVLGTAEAGSTVRVYTNASCTSSVAASGNAAAFNSPGFTVSVGDNTTTHFYATATDAVGNVSGCSSPSFAFVETSAVLTPTGLAATPASPANDNNPKVTGTAEPAMTIRVYTSADCSGAPVATGTTAQFAFPGLTAAVGDDSTTSFRATADDGAGNVSSCSDPATYTEDSTPPAAPSTLDSSPGSPANENDPEITGSAAGGSTVRLYTSSDCSGAPVATGSAANFASPGFTVSVANNSSTSFRATATDAAGNTSACSSAHTYVEDSSAPAAPSGLGSTPASPAAASSPSVTGTAEAGTTVRVYTTNDCSGAPSASGSAAAFGAAGLGVTVSDDSTTTFKATATDGAGNTSACSAGYTYVEDSTSPASTVSFPSAGGEYRAATWADFSGTASDVGSGLGRVELSIERLADGQFWNGSSFSGSSEDWRTAAGAASWSYSFPVGNYASDGQYRVRVRAVDSAGNAEAPSSRTYTIDRTAPNTTIDSGPTDPSNDANPSFTFSSDPGATFECSLDGGAGAACTSPKTYSSLGEASHTFSVTATDAAGNVDPTPATRTWTLDSTGPSTSYAFPAAGGSYNQAGWNDFSGSASDTGGAGLQQVELSIRSVASGNYWDGSSFASATQAWHAASGTGSWTLGFAATNFGADGDYEVRVRAVDNATNTSGALLRSFSVDSVPPQTTIDSGPSGDTASANASFTFSADQGGSTFECRLDSGSWGACASPKSYTGLGEASHTFDVRATDVGGNTDPTPASRTWVVDTMLPTAALDTPPSWIRQTVTLTATAGDSGSGVASVRFDRSPAGAGTWTPLGTDTTVPYSNDFDTTSVGNGLFDLRVVATDSAGNFQSSGVVTNIHVDNAAPNAVLDDPGAAVAGTVTLTHSSTDADSGIDTVQFQYRALPAGTWTDTGASWDTTALTDGQHELRVRVTDRAGNSANSAVETTLVDNTVPTVAYTVPTDAGYVNAASNDPLTLSASASDLGSGVNNVEFFACTAGGASCTSSTSLGVDSAGPYEASWPLPADGVGHLKAIATDNAARQATVVISVTVDRTVPDTNLLSNPGTPSNNPTPSFTFDSDDAGATFECRVDGGSWSMCTTPHTTAALADGNHTFDVRAVDAAGNTDSTPATWAWLVDATAPTATMDDPGANLRLTIGLTSSQSDPGAFASGIATVQYEYSAADAETWVGTASTWDTSAVADGLYDVHVVVTDNAGNVTTSTAVEDRRIDNTAPATSHDDPGANMRQTVTLLGQASDAGSGVQQVDFQISLTGANSWTTIGLAAGAPYQIGFDTTTYADGLYDFRTVARDVAGNQTDGAPVLSRRIDNTPPTASMNDPGAYLRGTINLTSVADDAGGSGVSTVIYEYSPAGANAWQPMSATWATDTVADGVYDLHVLVRDVAGNETISASVAGRRVDNTAPSTGHNAPSGWQSGAVTVSLSPDDAGGSGVTNTQFAVNGGSWQSGTSVAVSSDGIHTISFFSTDAAGNVESPRTATVMIDSTPPPPGANDPGNYLRGDVTLSANADTGGTGAEIDNVSFQYSPASAGTWSVIGVDMDSPYSVVWSTGAVADGAYDLRFEVTDEATPPNVSTEDLASKIVDNTPPTASMGSPLNGAVVSGGVTLGVSANDDNPIKQVEYFVRGSSAGVATSAPFQGSWNSAAAGDGPAQIYAVVEDMAGNSTTTNTITVTADNFAPAVSMSSPGPAIRGTVSLSASADGDTSQVSFERRPAGGGGWTTIGTANGAPWSTSFDTSTVADGDYELRAIATDAGGNSGTSSAVTTKVDNTNPSGALATPGNGQTVGGPAVQLEANASDGGSGVASVTFQYRQSGGGGWTVLASDSSAPFQASWDTTSLASVAHDLQAIVTDVAGNQFSTGITTVDVDSTAPGVTLTDPGAQLSGTVALSASTTGDATVVAFAYSPAGASSWTAIGSDGSAPYGVNFNTITTADGMYDLRAVVSDSVGNTSSSIRSGVRIDNFMPVLTSSNPANGSIVASANSVVLDFSEPAAASNLLLDGSPAPCAPPCSGSSVTLNTGPLADGSHTVTGDVTDGGGNSSSFSVSFVVGVPATTPSADTDEDGMPFVLPLVPTPADFRGRIEADGTLTLQWTSVKAGSTPLATILLVDGIATQSFAPGVDETNLGAFDPADMRTFSVAAVGTDGRVGPNTSELRSTSLLAGKPLAEVEASLVNRGLRLGTVSGSGSIVIEPRTALLVPLDHPVDVTLGEPTAPQTKLVFQVVGAKTFSRKVRKYVALRIKLTRPAQVTTTLLSPSGARVYRWRFGAKAGAGIVRLTMPPQVRKAGRYRLVFTVQSGRDVVKRTITLRVVGPQDRDITPARAPVDVVLAGNAGIRKDLALGLQGQGVRVTSASGDDDAFGLAGSWQRNVRVIVVDADRYGVGLVRDLATVFPGMRIIALTNDPRRLAQAIRAGATIAVPRSTPPKELARLIARLARR